MTKAVTHELEAREYKVLSGDGLAIGCCSIPPRIEGIERYATEENTTVSNSIKVTMGSVRLTGDQSRRLLEIAKANVAVECYEYWDKRLEQLGLVSIGPILDSRKASDEKWLQSSWIKARLKMEKTGLVPSEEQVKQVSALLNEIERRVYRMKRPYTQLTAAGRELAKNGMTVALRKER